MANTFTLNSASYDGRLLTLTCTQTPNASNNTSTINWTLTSSGGNSNYYSTGPTSVKINGTEVYYKARTAYSTQAFPAAKGSTSGTLTINHNSDGSKSIAVSLSTAIYTSTVSTSSGTWTLNNLSKPSTATCNVAYIGEPSTCIVSASNNSYTHKVFFTYNSEEVNILSDVTAGSYQFTIPSSFLELMGSSESVSAVVTCRTYSGSTLIGTTYSTIRIYTGTGDAFAPILTVSAADNNDETVALTGNHQMIIKGYSHLRYTYNIQGKNGATIKSAKVVNGSFTQELTIPSNSTTFNHIGTFNNATSGEVTFYAVDSRDNVSTETITLDEIDYIPLTCNLSNTNMGTAGNMTLTISGNYYNGDFNGIDNTLTVQCRYKVNDGEYGAWSVISPSINGNTYTASKNYSGLDSEAVYTFQGRAVDKLLFINSDGANIQSKPIFDWSGTDFNFNVPVHFSAGATGLDNSTSGSGSGGFSGDLDGDLTVNGNANITGDLRLKGSGNYGNTLYFGDSDYAYIKEVEDDCLTIHASQITLDGAIFTEDGEITSGVWTPSLYSGAVRSYTTRKGWFQQVNDCITFGFLIEANIYSGNQSRLLEINGLPFSLQERAFGGGVAFNVYCSGGYVFGCWGVDEDGIITARILPCNNSTAGNLNIASGVYYPTGGGSMTLSGTICCRIVT